MRTWVGESTELGMYVRSSKKKGLFLSVNAEKRTMAPMWKIKKNVDIDDSTSFLDHVYLGCTQRECTPNETIIEQIEKMFESRISAGATEELLG